MADNDPYLLTFAVTYEGRDGDLRKELVQAHNDELDRGDDDPAAGSEYYTLWRYLENGRRVIAFRCRREQWDATAAVRGVPATPEELLAADNLRRENAHLQDQLSVAMAELSAARHEAAEMAKRADAATRSAQSAQQRVAELAAKYNDVPF